MRARNAARYGAVGAFAFFFAKGLVWLAVLGWGLWAAV